MVRDLGGEELLSRLLLPPLAPVHMHMHMHVHMHVHMRMHMHVHVHMLTTYTSYKLPPLQRSFAVHSPLLRR